MPDGLVVEYEHYCCCSVTDFYDIAGVSNPNIVPNPEPGSIPPISEHGCGTLAVLQVDQTGRLPDEHSNSQMYVMDHFSILGEKSTYSILAS